MNKWLHSNYSLGLNKEFIYDKIKPRIICEKFIEVENDNLLDYKVLCFDGEPKLFYVISDRNTSEKIDFYDLNGKKLKLKHATYENSNYEFEYSKEFNKILKYAKILSKNFPHVRVDFYLNNKIILFGELTFFMTSGYGAFYPDEYDKILGDWLKLPKIN